MGAVLYATAPGEDAIDRGARADVSLQLFVGPGSLTLGGTF